MRKFLLGVLVVALLISAGYAYACYTVIGSYEASKTIECDDGSRHTISKRGDSWYWDGNRYETFELAAEDACGCSEEE
jgi:hypothetical protein